MAEDKKESHKETEDLANQAGEEPRHPEENSGNKDVEPFSTEMANALDAAPPQFRKIFAEMGMIHTTKTAPFPNALLDKVNPGHIDKFLDYNHKEDENIYNLQSSGRWFQLAYVSMAFLFLVFLVVFLSGNNQGLLNDILKILVVFAGGFGSGFGFKSYTEKRK